MSTDNIEVRDGKVKRIVVTQTYAIPDSPPSITINEAHKYTASVNVSTSGTDYTKASFNGVPARTWYGGIKRFRPKGIKIGERISNAFSGFFEGLLGGTKKGGRSAKKTAAYNAALQQHDDNMAHYNRVLSNYFAQEVVDEAVVDARTLDPSQLETEVLSPEFTEQE